MARHVVATVAELPPGSRKIVDVEGRSIGVFNVDGTFYALRNTCPHQAAPLCLGSIKGMALPSKPGEYLWAREGEILRCPWHGWEFDIRTGQSWCDPARLKAKRYAAAREPGAALAKGPYVAESFAVSVEEDYVVVEV